MKFNLELRQKQQLNMTVDLKTVLHMLTLNHIDLLNFINHEAMENVFIDLIEDSNFLSVDLPNENILAYQGDYNSDEPLEDLKLIDILEKEITVTDQLFEQLGLLNMCDGDKAIGELILHNLNEYGILKLSTKTMAKKYGLEENRINNIRKKILALEPKGMASQSIEEFLCLQTKDPKLIYLINNHLEELSENKIPQIVKKGKLTTDEIYSLIEKIKKLKPYPAYGENIYEHCIHYIVPDIKIDEINGELLIEILGEKDFFVISPYYTTMLNEGDQATRKYLERQKKRALFLYDGIIERRKNIEKVTRSIVTAQKEFFTNNKPLVPLSMKVIAEKEKISPSTVSRVVKNKYVECKRGVFPLNYFFTVGLPSQSSEKISADSVSDIIAKVIEEEDKLHPISDQKICNILKNQGIFVERRTVSKYRLKMGIPSTTNRKRYK